MENLKTVSALVKNILEHDHKARNTDNHLYLMVLEHYSGLRGIDIHAMTVPVFLKELDRRSFPGFETVRRSRQKVQATYILGCCIYCVFQSLWLQLGLLVGIGLAVYAVLFLFVLFQEIGEHIKENLRDFIFS